jgi:hypothetical protein
MGCACSASTSPAAVTNAASPARSAPAKSLPRLHHDALGNHPHPVSPPPVWLPLPAAPAAAPVDRAEAAEAPRALPIETTATGSATDDTTAVLVLDAIGPRGPLDSPGTGGPMANRSASILRYRRSSGQHGSSMTLPVSRDSSFVTSPRLGGGGQGGGAATPVLLSGSMLSSAASGCGPLSPDGQSAR